MDIFVDNLDLKYLKMLVDLGSYPVVILVEQNQRYVIFIDESILKYIQFDTYNFCCCTILDIKILLYSLKTIPHMSVIARYPMVLQSRINYHISYNIR